MRILVACQHYWPEPFNTADVCEELVRRGHEVTVITALPNTGMPGNEIPVEYRDGSHSDEIRNGVRVLRANLHPRRSGAKNRIFNYLSFWWNANKIARRLPSGYDVALGYQFSPVMQVDPALVYAKRNGIKALLYCFDLWPASLLAGGFAESGLPFRWMRKVSRRIYRQADRIAVTSPLFDEYFRGELGLHIQESAYLPQFADDIFSESEDVKFLPEGYERDKCNLTFAGNVGQAQSVNTIIEAAALLSNEPSIHFHIVGSGSQLEACRTCAKRLGLNNVTFHGRRPIEDMPLYYAASDAMLVTFEESPMARYTLPRKVTTYLAAGRPVLAAAEGETERVITAAGCGMCCPMADANGLARIAREFAGSVDKEAMGAASKRFYADNFTKEIFFSRLESLLLELTRKDD